MDLVPVWLVDGDWVECVRKGESRAGPDRLKDRRRCRDALAAPASDFSCPYELAFVI
jgi:hypothetical protein